MRGLLAPLVKLVAFLVVPALATLLAGPLLRGSEVGVG